MHSHRSIIFLHIPKTGGTSFAPILSADLELYDIVRQRFDQLMREYPIRDSTLRRFRRLSQLYGFAGHLLDVSANLMRYP